MEAPYRRVRGPLVNADGVKAAAGRGGVAGTQVLGRNPALVANVMVVHLVLHKLIGSSTETLGRSPHVLEAEMQNNRQALSVFAQVREVWCGAEVLLGAGGKRVENRERVVHSPWCTPPD